MIVARCCGARSVRSAIIADEPAKAARRLGGRRDTSTGDGFFLAHPASFWRPRGTFNLAAV
eukprot:5041812-Prymnesium_polylepis.1